MVLVPMLIKRPGFLFSLRSSGGFTIIELLVVVALMMMVVSASANIFLLVSRSQKHIIANQQIQGNVRFALESIVRDLHSGLIDYDYYQTNGYSLVNGGVVQPLQLLALRDAANQPVRYRLNNRILEVSRGLTDSWQPLLSDNIQVSNARFYIVPSSDPFVSCGPGGIDCSQVPNTQPRVTISLSVQNIPEPGYPLASLWLQTTVLARTYKR